MQEGSVTVRGVRSGRHPNRNQTDSRVLHSEEGDLCRGPGWVLQNLPSLTVSRPLKTQNLR